MKRKSLTSIFAHRFAVKKLSMSIVILIFTFTSLNPITVCGKNIESKIAEQSISVSQSYTEESVQFKHKGDCEDGPWDLNRTSKGLLYAYEWDSSFTHTGNSVSYCVELNKMVWSKEGVLSYRSIKLDSEFASRIASGDEVSETKQDKNSNIYVVYTGEYSGESNVLMLTVLNKKGKIVKDIPLNDILKQYETTGLRVLDMHVDGNIITFLVSEGSNSKLSIQRINWKTMKRNSSRKLDEMRYASIIGDYLYGVKYVKESNDDSGLSSGEYYLYKYSLNGKKELWNQKLPEGNLVMTDEACEEDYRKFDYDVLGDTIYVCNTEGIYSVDTSDENGDFTLVMSADQSTYLSETYTIVRFRVMSTDRFFLLSIHGFDEEWPTDLAMYTLKE